MTVFKKAANTGAKQADRSRRAVGKASKTERQESMPKEQIEKSLNYDFGCEIRFLSYQEQTETAKAENDASELELVKEIPWKSRSRTIRLCRRKPPQAGWSGRFLHQRRENEPEYVIRIIYDVPTFDSGDREYDSWHRLDLFCGSLPGQVDGVYSKGGYRLASSVFCSGLITISDEIRELLEECGIMRMSPQAAMRTQEPAHLIRPEATHRPGEKFAFRIPNSENTLLLRVSEDGKSLAVADGMKKVRGNLEIPAAADSLPITEIDQSAFWRCEELPV